MHAGVQKQMADCGVAKPLSISLGKSWLLGRVHGDWQMETSLRGGPGKLQALRASGRERASGIPRTRSTARPPPRASAELLSAERFLLAARPAARLLIGRGGRTELTARRTRLACVPDLWVLTVTLSCALTWSCRDVVSRLSQEIERLQQAASELRAQRDCYQTPDWALQSFGATIDTRRTSPIYELRSWFSRHCFWCSVNPPDTILQPGVSLGECWPMEGQQGQVVIRLRAKIRPSCVTLEHITRR
eukprot:XP_024999211.1 uncharacterized protein LOC107057469 [Gallus gallus]